MHDDNKFALMLFSVCSGVTSLLFWTILLSENFSTTKFIITFSLAVFSMIVSLFCAFFTIVDIGCLQDWYENFLEWNRERKIAKFKGENFTDI